MENFTLIFSTRERYCKAVTALWNNPKYELVGRGKYYLIDSEKTCYHVTFKKA